MPIQIDVTNGLPLNGASAPAPNETFQFVNSTPNPVTIANCSNWATPDGCIVPPAANGAPGVSLIFTVKNNPNKQPCAFSDYGWTLQPGMPHMGLNPVPEPMPMEEEKEVA